MKWFIVVLWSTIGADGKLDAYVFTKPSFDTKEACGQHAMNPQEIPKYIDRLVAEGMFIDEKGQFQKIDRVVCSPEDKIREVMILSNDISI